MSASPGPWSIARRAHAARRLLLLFVLGALLYGFGLHAARACVPAAAAGQFSALSAGDSCHGDVDVAEAACQVHCRTDAQSGRASASFDLPAAAPPDLLPALAPPAPDESLAIAGAPPRRVGGPPLHILLHRLLR